MAWLVREKNGDLLAFEYKPNYISYSSYFPVFSIYPSEDNPRVKMPSDADEKLIGKHITWEDEPVEI